MSIGHNQSITAERYIDEAHSAAIAALEAITRDAPRETIEYHANRAAASIELVKKMFDQAMDVSRSESVPMTVDKQAG